MKSWKYTLGCSLAVVTLLGAVGLAQEVEPPFTWKGKGEANLISEYGMEQMNVAFELSVDVDGGVKGKTSTDDSESTIKHLFYGERVEHELPNYFSRKVIVVLMINENGGDPMLAIMDGRVLAGRYFSGEVRLARYEPGSEASKALGVNDPMGTAIYEDYLPSGLKSALKKSVPFGSFQLEGGYKD